MDLRFTQKKATFRQEVRAVFDGKLPGDIREKLIDGFATMMADSGYEGERMTVIDTTFGDADHHLARLAELGGLPQL